MRDMKWSSFTPLGIGLALLNVPLLIFQVVQFRASHHWYSAAAGTVSFAAIVFIVTVIVRDARDYARHLNVMASLNRQ